MPDYKSMTIQPRPIRSPPYTVEAPGYQPVKGETIPRRNTRTKDELKTRPHEDIGTIHDVLKWSSSKFGNAKALGVRKLIKTHVENKKIKRVVDGKEEEVDKKWTYFELSGYSYRTFAEFEKFALNIGAGFRALGLGAGDRVLIYASTRYLDPVFVSWYHG
jgi:long-chain acyl-CoA synthetase